MTKSTKSTKRDEFDRHNRDEAQERAVQQVAAGPTHKPVPVEPYATTAVEPAARGASADLTSLVEEYERATSAELMAWHAARDQLAGSASVQSWNQWRDSVERTQRAARLPML